VPRMTKSADHKMMSSLSLAVRRTCHPLELFSLGAACSRFIRRTLLVLAGAGLAVIWVQQDRLSLVYLQFLLLTADTNSLIKQTWLYVLEVRSVHLSDTFTMISSSPESSVAVNDPILIALAAVLLLIFVRKLYEVIFLKIKNHPKI
jgi:hypothetical protein